MVSLDTAKSFFPFEHSQEEEKLARGVVQSPSLENFKTHIGNTEQPGLIPELAILYLEFPSIRKLFDDSILTKAIVPG